MNKKMQKKTLLITTMLLLTSICFFQTSSAEILHSVKGVLYINDEIAEENITIILNFTTGENSTKTYEFNDTGDNTNYHLQITDHHEEEGSFIVVYNEIEYIPVDNQTVNLTDVQINMDLHIEVEIPVNNAPNKPSDPVPEHEATGVNCSPALSVNVTDPDGDSMIVSFYLNDTLVETVAGVENGTTASITLSDLKYNTTYNWYAVANDSEFENTSDVFSFTTEEEPVNEPPTVKIEEPENALYFFGIKIRNHWFNIRRPLIIGAITIVANASDDNGVARVEFLIEGLFKDELLFNDTEAPFEYKWKWERPRLLHSHTLKVVAYDEEGQKAVDKLDVVRFI